MKSRFQMKKNEVVQEVNINNKDKYLTFCVAMGGCGEVSDSCLGDTKMMKSIPMTAFYWVALLQLHGADEPFIPASLNAVLPKIYDRMTAECPTSNLDG